jgi:hypothetical protein
MKPTTHKASLDYRGTNPLFVRDLSNEEYHGMKDILSKSTLDLFAKRPSVFHAHMEGRLKRKESDAMSLGTVTHTRILEPDTYADRYVVNVEGLRSNSKAYEAFVAANPGKDVISVKEHEDSKLMADAVMAKLDRIALAHGGVNPFRLRGGVTEHSLFWTHPKTGLRLRTRPDWMIYQKDGPCFIIDVKSTRDASPWGFDKSTETFRYDVSAAFYSDGYEAVFGKAPDAYLLVCVESESPHDVCVRFAQPEILTRGREAYDHDLVSIADCTAKGAFPDYPDDFIPMGLPKYAKESRLA